MTMYVLLYIYVYNSQNQYQPQKMCVRYRCVRCTCVRTRQGKVRGGMSLKTQCEGPNWPKPRSRGLGGRNSTQVPWRQCIRVVPTKHVRSILEFSTKLFAQSLENDFAPHIHEQSVAVTPELRVVVIRPIQITYLTLSGFLHQKEVDYVPVPGCSRSCSNSFRKTHTKLKLGYVLQNH